MLETTPRCFIFCVRRNDRELNAVLLACEVGGRPVRVRRSQADEFSGLCLLALLF